MSHMSSPSDEMIRSAFNARSALGSPSGLATSITAETKTTAQRARWPISLPSSWHRPGLLLFGLLSAATLATAFAVVGSRPPQSSTETALAARVIQAVNNRDVGILRAAFTHDGIIEYPAIDARPGREGDVLVSDGLLQEDADIWVSRVDKWGLNARLGACQAPSISTFSCAVVTDWHVLQLEIGEEWTFEVERGFVSRLQMVRVDPDPPNRVLPLGLIGLERWETWLRETHPEQADRLLPNGPDPFGYWYFRFGLDASPAEIGASIREYVVSRR